MKMNWNVSYVSLFLYIFISVYQLNVWFQKTELIEQYQRKAKKLKAVHDQDLETYVSELLDC